MVDWTAENDRKLLLCAIRSLNGKVDLDSLTAMFNEGSESPATKKAVTLRYGKLRRDADMAKDVQKEPPSTPTSNENSTNSSKKKSPGTGASRGKKKVADVPEAEDTPSAKRQKTAADAKKATTKGKAKGKGAAKEITPTDDDEVKEEGSDAEEDEEVKREKLDAELLALASD